MKHRYKITVFFLYFAFFGNNVCIAQVQQNSIFDALEQQSQSGDGIIVIHLSNEIKQLVGTHSDNLNDVNKKKYINTLGYRIHVYSGNLQRKSQAEADTLRSEFKKLFPNLESKTHYDAPFWRLYIGCFLMHEEASIARRELQKAFPQRKNEIHIVVDDIRVLLD